jgi:DNA-binding GntR family transcriptional regulator
LGKFEHSLGQQHRVFIDAILERDANRAVELWTQNAARITAFLLEQLQNNLAA